MHLEKDIKNIFYASMKQEALSIEKLGGMTNINFLITTSSDKFVLRVAGINSNEMINRQNEEQNQTQASKFGLSPQIVFFDTQSGIKITEFLDGALTLKPNIVSSYNKLIAQKLKQIHSSNMEFKNNFNPFEEMKKYLSLISDKSTELFCKFKKDGLDLFYELERQIYSINQELYGSNLVFRVTHGDLVPENILYQDGQIWIIDWEYSGLNDPCWDIASLFVESSYSSQNEREFLSCYELNGGEEIKIELYKSIQDILWTAWSIAKMNRLNSSDYYDYALERLDRAVKRQIAKRYEI